MNTASRTSAATVSANTRVARPRTARPRTAPSPACTACAGRPHRRGRTPADRGSGRSGDARHVLDERHLALDQVADVGDPDRDDEKRRDEVTNLRRHHVHLLPPGGRRSRHARGVPADLAGTPTLHSFSADQSSRPSWTTATGQGASCSTAWVIEPSRRPANRPRPGAHDEQPAPGGDGTEDARGPALGRPQPTLSSSNASEAALAAAALASSAACRPGVELHRAVDLERPVEGGRTALGVRGPVSGHHDQGALAAPQHSRRTAAEPPSGARRRYRRRRRSGPGLVAASARTTTTGQCACAVTAKATEPSSAPVSSPRPRDPTTSRAASLDASISAGRRGRRGSRPRRRGHSRSCGPRRRLRW